MRTSGARSGRWWVINAASLLVYSYVLSACATNAASALSPTVQPTDNKIISVLIFDQDNQPINEGVTIRVDGQPPQEDDNDDGGYYLQYCIEGQSIVAIAPKYRQDHPEPCATGKTQYVIKLNRIVLGTGLDYSWLSVSNCVGCHSDKYNEWSIRFFRPCTWEQTRWGGAAPRPSGTSHFPVIKHGFPVNPRLVPAIHLIIQAMKEIVPTVTCRQ